MGFLRSLGDSARILGDSGGFSGFLQKLYEVSKSVEPFGLSHVDNDSQIFLLKDMIQLAPIKRVPLCV